MFLGVGGGREKRKQRNQSKKYLQIYANTEFAFLSRFDSFAMKTYYYLIFTQGLYGILCN